MFRMTLLFADSYQARLNKLMHGKRTCHLAMLISKNRLQQYFLP